MKVRAQGACRRRERNAATAEAGGALLPAPSLRLRARAIVLIAQVAVLIAVVLALVLPAGALAKDDAAPTFISIRARALATAGLGELVVVRARVENSASCGLALEYPDDLAAQHSTRWRPCENGRFSERISIRPKRSAPIDVAEVRLFARNSSGTIAARNLTVNLRSPQRSITGESTRSIADLAAARSQSTAWAGYVSASNSPTTLVSATWTIPAVTCGSGTTWLGIWLGVDGAEATGPGAHELFQVGVYSYCIDGKQQNEAWWEVYPGPANPLGAVNSGDTIDAAVRKTAGGWLWSIADASTGAAYQPTQPIDYSGPGGTADWIVEDPGTPAEPFVTGFAPITFTKMSMTTADGTSFASGSTWQMVQDGDALATPIQSASAIGLRQTMTIRSGGRLF